MVSREQQDMAVLSLQLIVLRLCEKLAKISQSQYSADLPIVLPILFEWFETSTNPLQFAIFFFSHWDVQWRLATGNICFHYQKHSTNCTVSPQRTGRFHPQFRHFRLQRIKIQQYWNARMFLVCVDQVDGVFHPTLRIENVCTDCDFLFRRWNISIRLENTRQRTWTLPRFYRWIREWESCEWFKFCFLYF